jgi:hypothetical protein
MKNPEETAMIKMPKTMRTAQTGSRTVFIITGIFRTLSKKASAWVAFSNGKWPIRIGQRGRTLLQEQLNCSPVEEQLEPVA